MLVPLSVMSPYCGVVTRRIQRVGGHSRHAPRECIGLVPRNQVFVDREVLDRTRPNRGSLQPEFRVFLVLSALGPVDSPTLALVSTKSLFALVNGTGAGARSLHLAARAHRASTPWLIGVSAERPGLGLGIGRAAGGWTRPMGDGRGRHPEGE